MNYIALGAPTEDVARELCRVKAGYHPASIGRLVHIEDDGDNSRQRTFVFETDNDVTANPDFAEGRLSDAYSGLNVVPDAEDGPLLAYGREVTVGG